MESELNNLWRLIYDAWEKVKDIGDSSADTVGKLNSMWYRGYHQGMEAGIYYLQSRYYDVETGSFINADELKSIYKVIDRNFNSITGRAANAATRAFP